LATGFQATSKDDFENMARQFPAYDALYDNPVKSALRIDPGDLIIGFIYLRTDIGGPGIRSQRTSQEFAQYWIGGGGKPPSS